MLKVFIEMERLRNLHSGLGQFCLYLGKALLERNNGLIAPQFYVPKKADGIFGSDRQYRTVSTPDKYLGVRADGYDIWHCTHQESRFLPRGKNVKLLLTIHDLNFLEKHDRPLKRAARLRQVQRSVNRAAALVTDSRFTEQVVRENLDVPDIPVKVIYLGNPLQAFSAAERPQFLPPGEFIFTIGIIGPKKNFHVLLPLLKYNPALRLVIAGSTAGDYAAFILDEAKRQGVSERVVLPGVIDDEARYWLYKNCRAFVFPSLTEGFGLPAVEAMSLGKPVFLSRLTSLPEIGGNAAYYWQDFSPERMAEAFRAGLEDYDSNPGKPELIRQWARQFSWERAADEYLKLYVSLGKK